MGQERSDIGQHVISIEHKNRDRNGRVEDFVLEKSIFSNVFEKDIRRVYIYKKAERLAKALHMITPAFVQAPSLKDRIDRIAMALIDAAIVPPSAAREALSRELLALSSVLGVARAGGLLSSMNADLITGEVRMLLQEIASYEEPRLFLEEAPSLAELAKRSPRGASAAPVYPAPANAPASRKGHVKDTKPVSDRRDSILSVIRTKGKVSIKDISTVVRGVSEKTIQRELTALVTGGTVRKEGERRWSVYSLA